MYSYPMQPNPPASGLFYTTDPYGNYSGKPVNNFSPNLVQDNNMQPPYGPLTVATIFPAALWAAAIGGANELGRNLHKVQSKEITMAEAIRRSLVRGAATSLATTTASALTSGLRDQSLLHLATLAVTTTGLSYLMISSKLYHTDQDAPPA